MPRKKVQKTYRRKHCDNCNKWVDLNKKNRRFCSDHCRYEWNNNKSGYGKLRGTLERLVKFEVKRKLAEHERRLEELERTKQNGGLHDTIAAGEARERRLQESTNGKP